MNMRRLFVFALIMLASITANAGEDILRYVNPRLGTVHSRWFFFTPAAEPFGMAKLGASTNGTYGNKEGWEAVGYEDGHTSIDGFPCLHEFQIGGIALMPIVGKAWTVPGRMDAPAEGWRSTFDKAAETASPGYYAVRLRDYGVQAELGQAVVGIALLQAHQLRHLDGLAVVGVGIHAFPQQQAQ